jgi:hypothetical protein
MGGRRHLEGNLRHLTFGPTRMAAERIARLQRYKARAVQLAEKEARLRASVSKGSESTLAGKKVCLFKEMCVDAGVKDKS